MSNGLTSHTASTASREPEAHPQEAHPPDEPALEQIAAEVLRECRNALMTKLRFLDVALWQLEPAPAKVGAVLATDGAALRYEPLLLALRFRGNPNEAVRDYLQVVLHCLFRQPFDEKHDDGRAWSLASDVVAESLAMELCGERFPSEGDEARAQELERLKKRCGSLSPTKLYRAFSEATSDAEIEELYQLEALFARDDHRLWACMRNDDENGDETRTKQGTPDEPSQDERSLSANSEQGEGESANKGETQPGEGQEGQEDQDPADQEDPPDDREQDEQDSEDSGDSENPQNPTEPDEPSPADSENEPSPNTAPQPPSPSEPVQGEEAAQAQQDWENIAKQVELDLESRSLAWDESAGSLVDMLSIANRQTCNYADFLRKFSVLTEDIKINEDEFDYLFYTYGLKRYGNMPLVEPLEYQECDRVREFVIAIDTSGSCSGELVRTFVSRTYDILKESESYGSTVNVHIVQCDARVQSDTKIASLQELDCYLGSFELRGFGGTDFRPVFEYVNKLIDEGEFSNLRGLVYFTDGLGTFPERKPAYDTAFVFVNDEMATPKVPPWAMKAVLDEAGVNEL